MEKYNSILLVIYVVKQDMGIIYNMWCPHRHSVVCGLDHWATLKHVADRT